MSKNKQPRDENGKFTKMIKVTDKFGNAAYFSPEEMAGFKATPKNPDCEPATKAYSKYIGRYVVENSSHSHHMPLNNDLRNSLLFVFGLSTFCFGLIWLTVGTSLNDPNISLTMTNIEFAKTMLSISTPVSIISALITFCAFTTDCQPYRTESSKCEMPNQLRAYTPPRKDECGE